MSSRLNLIVFIDGTGNNTFKQSGCNSTNISRLWRACEHAGTGEVNQRTYYKPGVGTRKGEELVGNAFGMYLQDRVDEALDYLENELTKQSNSGKDIHVYMYGFSRGAYAVRCLAAKYHHPIEVLGVFDTVKATIEHKIDVRSVPDNVKFAFHAMAIDEHRSVFDITRFAPRKNVFEVWFTGCHSDVGGYYIEGDLSYITLDWMVNLSKQHGLVVDRSLLPTIPDTFTEVPCIHNEKDNAGWRIIDWFRGKSNFDRTIAVSDYVHPTVNDFRALGYAPKYLPVNMYAWSNEMVENAVAIA